MAEQNSSLSRETLDRIRKWIEKIANHDQANLEIMLDQLRHKLDSRLDGITSLTNKSIALQAICWLIFLGSLGIVVSPFESMPPPYGKLVVLGLRFMAIYYLFLAGSFLFLIGSIRTHSSGQSWEEYAQEECDGSTVKEELVALITDYAMKDEQTKQDAERLTKNYHRLLWVFRVGIIGLLLIASTIFVSVSGLISGEGTGVSNHILSDFTGFIP